MLERIITWYAYAFGSGFFYRLNWLLLRLSLAGLGVLNYKTSKLSGELRFLRHHLRGKKGVVLDVGANRGSWAKLALESNDALLIYAFEPHPVTFKSLAKNLVGQKNVVLINKGVSDRSGYLKLYDYADQDGSSHASLFDEVIKEIHKSYEATTHDVQVVSLDQFCYEQNIDEIVLLKIDVEGNELNVLKGAERMLRERKIKMIQFEFNEMNVVSRVFAKDFFTLLDGYKIYRLLPRGMLDITDYSPLKCEIYAYQNLVAIAQQPTYLK